MPRSVVVVVLIASLVHGEDGGGRIADEKEIQGFLEELGERSGAVKTLRVKFLQEKKLKLLRRPRVSTAELVFADGKLVVTTRGRGDEVESRLLFAQEELRIYYPALERLEVYPSSPTDGGGAGLGRRASLPLFTGDWKRLEKDYRVSMRVEAKAGGKDKEPVIRLTLVPRDGKSRTTKIAIELLGHRIREYVQEEVGGTTVKMKILSWRANEKVDPSTFSLDVPKGTKTIHIGSKKRSSKTSKTP